MLACLYRTLGTHESIGRGLTALLSLFALLGVYLVSSSVADPAVGLRAAFFYAVLPMPVYFGRTVMPESLLVAGCCFGLFRFLVWARGGSSLCLLWSGVAMAIACLVKPSCLHLGLPFAYLAFRKRGLRAGLAPELWVFALLVIGPMLLWYPHAAKLRQMTGLTFGIWRSGFSKWASWGVLSSWEFWEKILVRRVPYGLLGYFGVPMLIAGPVMPRRSRTRRRSRCSGGRRVRGEGSRERRADVKR